MLNVIHAWLLRPAVFFALTISAVVPASAASRLVSAGEDLQNALNQAQGGDTITLAAGATFKGNFVLPPNPSGQWITIQSSMMSSLPGAWGRVAPQLANLMPKIVTPNAGAALIIPSGSNYYRIQGIEFSVEPWVYVNDLIEAGTVTETSISELPHHLVFDRNYVHGDPNSGGKRGLALNSGMTVVQNSYFKDFLSDWQDTQAICGWNGIGPFTIKNNHLEAAGEIVAFGGATPSIPGLVPSDIMISNNEFYKPMSWWYFGKNYIEKNVRAKNHLELKNAQKVTIQNNTFTNNYVGADQLGFMLVLGVRDEGGLVPWATVSNVTVKNNLFQHTAAGVLLMGHDADGGGTAGNFTFTGNTWLDMGGYGGDGRMYEILNEVHGINIDHETAFPTGWLLVFDQAPSSGVKVTNSIFTAGWGIVGTGVGTGEPAMAYYNADGMFANNALINGWWYGFTGDHFGPYTLLGSIDEAGFSNFTGNDVSLANTSVLKGQATDSSDLGSNFKTILNMNTTGVSALNPTGSGTAPNGWVNIVSKLSGKCMDLATWQGSDWGQAPGTRIAQFPCWGNGTNSMQLFQFNPTYDGYKISIKLSGQQLEIGGGPGATSPGTVLQQWQYWGGMNQLFEISSVDGEYVTLHPVHSQLCLGLEDNSTDNNIPVVQKVCTGSDEQQWKFVPAR